MISIIASAALLQVKQADLPTNASPKLWELMNQTKFSYRLSSSRIAYLFDANVDKRKQLVYVNTKTSTHSSDSFVFMYTQVWGGKEPPSSDLLKKVALSSRKFGTAYVLKFAEGNYAIRFGLKLMFSEIEPPADSKIEARAIQPEDTAWLKDHILYMAAVGEELESSISSEDKY